MYTFIGRKALPATDGGNGGCGGVGGDPGRAYVIGFENPSKFVEHDEAGNIFFSI